MLGNFITVVLFIIASFAVGYAFMNITELNRSDHKCFPYLYAPVGVSIYAVVAAFVYFRLGLLINAVRIVWIVMAILSLIYIFIYIRKESVGRDQSIIQPVKSLVFLIILFCLMITPGLKRGANYYAYKGNIYDKFAYISESAYMVNHDATYGDYEMQQEEYYPDSLESGYFYIVRDRPVASLLFSGVAYKGDVFFCGYLFISMMWAMICCPMIVIIECIFPGKKKPLYLIFALIYVFSIFCQLQNDIDAWSQECGASMLITFTAIWLVLLKSIIYENSKLKPGQLIGIALQATGAFMVYAEATWVYGLVLVIMTLIVFSLTHSWNKYKEILKAVVIPVIMLSVCYIAHPGTFICNFGHILFATASSNQGWTHFYKYWMGYHEFISSSHIGAVIKQIMTIIPCWNGMYMLTPIYTGIPMPVILVWLLLLGILSLGILGLFVYTVYYIIRGERNEHSFSKSVILISGMLSIAFFTFWILVGQYLTAAKSLLFISPFIYFVLSMPIMDRVFAGDTGQSYISKKTMIQYCLLVVSLVFIICQISALGLRILQIKRDKNGVMALGYYYPQMESAVKESFDFNFDASQYEDEDHVAVVGGNGYSQLYVKLCLVYYDVDYYTVYDWGAFDFTYNEDKTLQEGDTAIYLRDYER